jgi:signal transduction histidine kinase
MQLQQATGQVPVNLFVSPEFPAVDPIAQLPEVVELEDVKIVTVRPSDNPMILVSLSRSNQRLLSQLQNLRIYLFAANAGAIVLAGILVFASAGLMLRPIKKITDVAAVITAANRIGRVPVPNSQDESRLLAETINQMLERIELAIRNQVNFFASATHELKTPLAVMQTELSLAISQSPDAATRKILESQLTEVQRLSRVIHDFLLISQLKSNSLTLRARSEQPEEIVFAAIRKVKYRSLERGSFIRVTLPEEPIPALHLDFDKMETVVANLLENAIRYSPAGVTVEVRINPGQIEVINPTEGLAVIPVELDREFKSSTLSSGLGMGLWLCYHICRLHQATLSMSAVPGQVTTTIRFS